MTHESLAHYVDFFADRPIIMKIHRDLLLNPKSSEDETKTLEEAWKPVLEKAFSIYTPIVLGYGGNDES